MNELVATSPEGGWSDRPPRDVLVLDDTGYRVPPAPTRAEVDPAVLDLTSPRGRQPGMLCR